MKTAFSPPSPFKINITLFMNLGQFWKCFKCPKDFHLRLEAYVTLQHPIISSFSILNPLTKKLAAFSKSSLDCDFSEDCCWATTREEEQWEIQSADELDLNEFRKVFLVGKSRPPPSGNYAIRVENKKKSSLISCAVCSASGQATVKFR